MGRLRRYSSRPLSFTQDQSTRQNPHRSGRSTPREATGWPKLEGESSAEAEYPQHVFGGVQRGIQYELEVRRDREVRGHHEAVKDLTGILIAQRVVIGAGP